MTTTMARRWNLLLLLLLLLLHPARVDDCEYDERQEGESEG